MANTLLTISEITNEALMVLENSLTVAKHVSRDYDDQFAVKGGAVGNTINIRKPPRYVGTTGPGLNIEDATETSVPLSLTTQFHVDIAFTTVDMTLSITDFSRQFIKPQIAAIANKVDFDTTLLYQSVYNTIGTPGVIPNALATYLDAQARLDDEAAPTDDRVVCMTPKMNAKIVDALKGLLVPGAKVEKQFNKGRMGEALNMDWYMDQNLRTHTIGPLGGTPAVNGANQVGNSLITNGWTAAAANRLKKGDVFTIANVFAVNPQNRQPTQDLRQFVATADAASDGAGNLTVQISPAIIVAGPFQTVDSLPANGAAITVFGAASTKTPQGLMFHESAFALGFADLILPEGVDRAARVSDKQLGISIRLVRQYDINTDRLPCRTDVLYGTTTTYAEMACRIAS